MYINQVPADVKTIIDKIEFQTKIEKDLEFEVLGSIKRIKLIQDINSGINQGARIILLNATTQSLGYAIDMYAISNKIDLCMKDAIDNSIRLANTGSKDFVPVLVFKTCIDYDREYRLSALTVKMSYKKRNGQVYSRYFKDSKLADVKSKIIRLSW